MAKHFQLTVAALPEPFESLDLVPGFNEVPASGAAPAADGYRRPDGTSQYLRPDGTSTYLRP